jgi:hypothetical protein
MSRFRALVPSRAMAVALLALFVALSGTAMAATGGNFILGQSNTATTQTALSRTGNGKALQITNTGVGLNSAPLGLTAAPGHPPFVTNSQAKVDNLNADLLDNQDSTAYQQLSRSTTVPTSDCVTSVQTWTGCAPVTIHVPAGKTWVITVESTVNGFSAQTQTIGFCAAYQGPQCMDFQSRPELLTLWGGAYTMGTSTITWYLGGPTTFTAQTAIKLGAALTATPSAKTTTRVDVYDAGEELSP